MITFFITPSNFVKIGTKAAGYLPIVGPSIEYTKKAKTLTQLSDPVTASTKGVGMMFKFCYGKSGLIAVECMLWLTCSIAGGLIGSPGLIGAGVTFGNMLVDEMLD